MKTFSRQAFHSLAKKVLLWGLQLAAAGIFIFVAYLGQQLWEEFSEQRKVVYFEDIDRNVGHLSLNDTISNRTENVRWVNLFLDDVIITSNHPIQLEVETAPAAIVERSAAPDEAPSKDGESMSASTYLPPLLHPIRRQYPHESDDDDDPDSVFKRKISLRGSLQGLRRYGALVRVPLPKYKRWSVETGLTYGSLKTTDKNNSCIAIPLRAIYYFKPKKHLDFYALGGPTIEKVCKGNTPLQLLLQAGVGAEYHFNKKLGVFVEPSLRYHIGSDSNIPELYGKRLGMNIHLGVTYIPWKK